MSKYADILENEDPRISQMFDVKKETEHMGGVLIEDPFPALNRLRDEAPVHEGALADLIGSPENRGSWYSEDRPIYSAMSFEAVSQTLIDNETFSSHGYNVFGLDQVMGNTILNTVGQTHRRLKDPIQPMFSPQTAASWWDATIIEETVDVLLSAIEKKGRSDLFIDLCARMPVHVVSAGFGIAPEDIIPFRLALLGEQQDRSVADILNTVIDARRDSPENDVISKMVNIQVKLEDGGSRPITNEEIIANAQLIIMAGGGTTWRQFGITLYALLNNPEQFAQVKADRNLIPKVVLESARWHSTDLIFPRLVTKDVNLAGVDIPEGAIIHMCLGSANRDPKRWDNPDVFDINRPIQRSVAFGAGPHSCLGQHVSRQEMVAGLNGIIDRLGNVRWDESAEPASIIGGLFARGPSSIPVIFD